MAPIDPPPMPKGKPKGQEHKSWKKINEERKTLKREKRQEKWIKELENAEKLKEMAKASEAAASKNAMKMNPSTISIAVPGSILENAQSPELRSYVAGQIARAASIFRVNEVIVFDDIGLATARDTKVIYENEEDAAEGADATTRTVRSSSLQLARILQYLECPQYLRKFFFPLHKDLKFSGILNPLDTPHHLRQQSVFLYRDGIVTEKQAKEGRCFVNVGLLNDVLVDKAITPGVRVTVKLSNLNESKKMRGVVVSPDEPRRETGVYWGYTVRIAHSLAEIFSKSPYSGGYDRTIGTSDRGSNVQNLSVKSVKYNHLLIVFGGLAGLEAALANDEKLSVDDPALLFDHYLNVLPKQGSRTIRTEEAVLIAMTALQEKLAPRYPDNENTECINQLPRSEDTGVNLLDTTSSEEKPKNEKNPFNKPQSEQSKEDSCTEYDKLKEKQEIQNSSKNPFVNSHGKEGNEGNVVDKPFMSRQTIRNLEKKARKRQLLMESKKEENTMQENKDLSESVENKKIKVVEDKEVSSTTPEAEDFEIVPTVGNSKKPTKGKKIKPDYGDLSRFD